jgi:signal transduction histidine kinase
MKLSLRTKGILLLAGYSMVVEVSILTYFYYSGRDAIEKQSRLEVMTQAALAGGTVERTLSDCITELAGLRSLLRFYGSSTGAAAPSLKPAEELVVALPWKYAAIGLVERPARRMATVRAVREFGRVYPIVESREVQDGLVPDCHADHPDRFPGRACVFGPRPGSQEQLIEIVVPLTADGSGALIAYVYIDHLFEGIGKSGLPSNLSIVASDRRGLILHARDVSLLRTNLRDSLPHVLFRPDETRPAGEKVVQGSGRTIYSERLEQPDLMLIVERDDRADYRELNLKLLRIALFAAGIALVAVIGAWTLTGRMAASLGHVSEVANAVANGDFTRRIALRRSDELGILIGSFNTMTGRLEESYRVLNETNLKLQRQVDEVTRTRRRLSQKQRLALVGEAMSKVSHEIQNKIGGMGVWIQNLERFAPRDENTTLCVQEMKAALASSLGMLVRFKSFYRQPHLLKTSIPARALIEGCLVRVRPAAEAKSLSIVTDPLDDSLRLDVDPEQFSSAAVNILLNAVYFSPERGIVRVGLRREAGWAILSVRDRGPGLPGKDKLFQPFFTTKPLGSGLGLAISRNIILAHSGRIRARNRSGGGACFEILLPDPHSDGGASGGDSAQIDAVSMSSGV